MPRRTELPLVVRLHGWLNRAGLFRLPGASALVTRAYFTYKRLFEDSLLRLARRHPELFVGGHIIDVGANVGYTAALFAKRVTPPFQVHAFEPDARNFEQLERSIERLRLAARVSAVRSAVGASNGPARLWCNPRHSGDHRVLNKSLEALLDAQPTTSVQMTSIDAYVAARLSNEPVALIKIDVQGYEPEVCRGMIETLERTATITVIFEFDPLHLAEFGFHGPDLLEFFLERGFRLYTVGGNGELQPYAPEIYTAGRPYVDIVARRAPSQAAALGRSGGSSTLTASGSGTN